MKLFTCLGILLAVATAFSNTEELRFPSGSSKIEPESSTYWYGSVGVVFGFSYIGSEEAREGIKVGLNYAKPEPRLRWNGYKAQVVYSVYFMTTRAGGFDEVPVNQLFTYGFGATARYHVPFFGWDATFVDLGWGLAYSNRETRDLDALFNSTPSIGIGAILEVGGTELILSGKWFHMSNAGISGSNQGMNSFVYSVGVRF